MPASVILRLALALAVVGGFCDAASLLLVRTFAGHVTGNFVFSAVKLATGEWRGMLTALLAIGFFLLGTYLGAWMTSRAPARALSSVFRQVLGLEAALIVAAWVAWKSAVAIAPELYLATIALALGLQNGALRRAGGSSVHTTFLTGMLTTFVAERASSESLATDWRVPGSIWLCFLAGAVAGALAVSRLGPSGVLGAALLLALIVAWLLVRHAATVGDDL